MRIYKGLRYDWQEYLGGAKSTHVDANSGSRFGKAHSATWYAGAQRTRGTWPRSAGFKVPDQVGTDI